MSISIVWFRKDLRLHDNEALLAAVRRGFPILLLYLYDEESFLEAPASKWWLCRSLAALAEDIRKLGSTLIVRNGSEEELLKVVQKYKVDAVYWHRDYEPGQLQKETDLQKKLQKLGCLGEVFSGNFLFPPGSICTPKGDPYKVFTPFMKAVLKEKEPRKPFGAPKNLFKPVFEISSCKLPIENSIDKENMQWTPGERGALDKLSCFLSKVEEYPVLRDFPAEEGTSLLSPHLHFGEISPFTLWHKIKEKGGEVFLRQLIWREFAAALLYFFPETKQKPLRSEFTRMQWNQDKKALSKWQQGNTGYPIVDAGMRQLLATGWMHNRVRMIVASFLVKDLGIDWKEGASWFFAHLVDADLANNTFGWQWAAGCGADAAPYFRVFNPELQGKKFDETGAYVRKYVPELAAVPDEWIHNPAGAPTEVLQKAGLSLGKDYPYPMVDHKKAREEALRRYAVVRSSYD